MKIRKISGQQLKGMLAGEDRFVAVFTASWCSFCRVLRREVEAATLDFTVVEVDISDEGDSSWEEFEISTVPTALLFEDGKEAARRPPSIDGLRLKDLRELGGRRSGSP
ncbi:MAG: thioredoxin family protein [Candidatus Verstraetearchaeota archaeon]|nr:thioredoxin family protein [Candidatus Verstraetearchaeota archaeon]